MSASNIPISYTFKSFLEQLLLVPRDLRGESVKPRQERLAVLDEVKLRKMRRALDIADEQLELKRDRVSDALKAAAEPWHRMDAECFLKKSLAWCGVARGHVFYHLFRVFWGLNIIQYQMGNPQ